MAHAVRIGLSIDLKTILGSCNASSRLAQAFVRAAVSSSRTSSKVRSNRRFLSDAFRAAKPGR